MSEKELNFYSLVSPYENWIKAQGIPIHRGYYMEDLKTLKLGRWEERGYDAAFIVLAGQEGISETHVSEIGPGKSLLHFKFALDEIIYVLEGRGLTTFWESEGGPWKTFEWQKHSMFLIPRNYRYQLSNSQGNKPVRLLHYNYLPLAMAIIPNPSFFFNNSLESDVAFDEEFYSQIQSIRYEVNGGPSAGGRISTFWYANFVPDMKSWDKFQAQAFRGAGSRSVGIRFPNAPIWAHMPQVPPQSYKKAHRHGPGVAIVVVEGEGYSIMWQEGHEKVVVPWHEGSLFVPPNNWFHQHFNSGATPARYLAFHAPKPISKYSDRVEDLTRDQIEYTDEEPWIRQKFADELANKGLKSMMPEEAYRDSEFQWQAPGKD